MPTPSLVRVRCLDADMAVGLVNYADMVVYDQEKNVVALRIGGYPETVQAMSDAILGGCELELTGSKSSLCLNSKGISHDGVYAEGIHWLQDDSLQSLAVGQEDDDPKSEKETVSLKRNLYIFCTSSAELFDELDRKLSVPLLPEFRGYFLSELKKRGLLDRLKVYCPGRKFQCWHMSVSKDESEIVQVLEDGLKDGCIAIPGSSPGQEDVFRHIPSFTAYLREFGDKIAGRIKDCFPPRFNPAEEAVSPPVQEVNRYVLAHAGYSLFDAQLGAAEALKRQLETDRLALLVAECGTGKSKIGAAALYAYQHGQPDRRTNRKAFNVVVCPSHLTGKWVRELHETVPNCFAQFEQHPGHRPAVQPIPKGKQNSVLHSLQRDRPQRVYAPAGRNLEPAEERVYLPGLRQGAGDARSRHFRLGEGGRPVFSAREFPQPPLPFLRRFPLDSPESRRPDAKTNPVGAHRRLRLCPPPVCLSGGRNL